MELTRLNHDTTEKLLRLCYNCNDVHRCETEEKCVECFLEHTEPDAEDIELREAFRLYAY
jgi:hypothetical protein